MQTSANDAVNIPKGPTGPKTEAGKAKSSRNAIRTGLYAARDFIREGEEEEYAQTLIKLMDELTPEGTMEQTFATEIMGATWRLRRCRLAEEAFSSIEDLDFDPMLDERTERQQRSLDRARSQSHLILRRSIAELRKLQTQRTILAHLEDTNVPCLTDVRQVAAVLKLQEQANSQPTPAAAPPPDLGGFANMDALMALADKQLAQQYREGGLSSFCNPAPVVPPSPIEAPPVSSFCKPAPQTQHRGQSIGRNNPCPCGSGVKYKRCCGGTGAGSQNVAVNGAA